MWNVDDFKVLAPLRALDRHRFARGLPALGDPRQDRGTTPAPDEPEAPLEDKR